MVGDKSEGQGSPPIFAQPRLTPYELVFTERFEAEVFPEIEREAEQTGSDPAVSDAFQLLSAVGSATRDQQFRGPEALPAV